MKLIDKLLNKNTAEKSLWDTGDSSTTPFFMKNNVDVTILDLYKNAYARVNLIAKKISALDQRFERKLSEDIVQKHALISLFNNPSGQNDDTSSDDFINALVSSILVNERAFIIFNYNPASKYPISMEIPIAGQVTIDKNGSTITGFRYKDRLLNKNEYIHFSGWSPLSNIGGISPLSTVTDHLNAEQLIALHQIGLFKNNAIPAGAVVVEADKLTFKSIKEQWENNYKGAGNNNKLAFIRKDPGSTNAALEYKQYTTDNTSLDLKTLYDRIDKKINEAFGVPKEMMGDIQSTNLAGVRLATSIFWDNTGTPLAKKIDDKINRWISINFPNDDIKLVTPTPKIEDLESESMRITIQDKRIDMAIKLIDAGYDEKEVFEYLDIKQLKRIPIASEVIPKNVTLDTPLVPTIQKTKKKDNIAFKALKPEEVPVEYKELTDAIYSFLDDEYSLVSSLEDVAQLDTNSQATILSATMLPIIVKLYNKVGSKQLPHYLEAIGMPVNSLAFELDFATEVGLASYVNRVSLSFETDTLLGLKNIQQLAVEQTWSLSFKKKELTNYYKKQGEYIQQGGKMIKNNARYRADRLSTTETIRANNQASLKSIQDISSLTGTRYEKVWRRTRSEPEPLCDYMNGKTVGIYEPFVELGGTIDIGDNKEYTNNFATVHTPGIHPFCSCILEYREV